LVDRDQSTLKGQRIEYLLPTKVLKADGAAANSQSGRVEMVLQPNQTDKDKKAAPATGPATSTPPGTPAPSNAPTTTTPATPPAAATPAANPSSGAEKR
jgi:hypothetical protein